MNTSNTPDTIPVEHY